MFLDKEKERKMKNEKNICFYQYYVFYEFCFNLVGFFMLSKVYFTSVSNGYTTSLYLVYYGLIRTILEPFRYSSYILMWNGLQISRLMSFIMIFVGILIYIIISVKLTRKKVRVRRHG